MANLWQIIVKPIDVVSNPAKKNIRTFAIMRVRSSLPEPFRLVRPVVSRAASFSNHFHKFFPDESPLISEVHQPSGQ